MSFHKVVVVIVVAVDVAIAYYLVDCVALLLLVSFTIQFWPEVFRFNIVYTLVICFIGLSNYDQFLKNFREQT